MGSFGLGWASAGALLVGLVACSDTTPAATSADGGKLLGDSAAGGGSTGAGGAPAGGSASSAGGRAVAGGGGASGGSPAGGAAGTPSSGGVGAGGAGGGGGGAGAGGAGAGGAGASGGTGGMASGCLAAPLLTALGQTSVLVGASMSDATAAAAPFDLRYEYLSGGLFDGASPCARCDTACTAKGTTCANKLPNGSPAPGCAWWGCWQYDQDPPGGYARGFFGTGKSNGQILMITYYQVLQASGAAEGAPEVTATKDAAFMGRYLADVRV